MATGLENLWIYQLAEDLEIEVHSITKRFPRDETYRSVDQLRRSSASVANNIAESYHKSTVKEKIRFLSIAKGEAEETKRNISRSFRKGFVAQDVADSLMERYTTILKGTNSYIKFLEMNALKKPTTNKPKLKTRN